MSSTLKELEAQVTAIKKELESLNDLRKADQLQQEQIDTLTNAADRLSLAVLGDEQLGVKGLVKTVEELKDQSMSTKLSKAKWAGVGIAILAIAKGLWAVGSILLGK